MELLLLQNLHCIRDEKIEEWGVLLLNIICVLLFCQRDKNWVFILMSIVLEFLSFFPIVAMHFQFHFIFVASSSLRFVLADYWSSGTEWLSNSIIVGFSISKFLGIL
jgi:hypothetical protein